MKDVIVVPARKQVELDFTADNPGPTLFYCHPQLHMDYGFMTMVQYEGREAGTSQNALPFRHCLTCKVQGT